MTHNLWTEHAAALAEAYARSAGSIRFELVTRQLLLYLPDNPQRIVDVGGGYGRQAIMLARAGHSVVVIDFDSTMLSLAAQQLANEPADVASRVELILGEGVDAPRLVGGEVDLACCHSVLAYEPDPEPIIRALVDVVRPGGLISVMCVNQESIAMRSALEGQWKDAQAALFSGRERGPHYVESRAHTRREISALLDGAGATVLDWQGVGVFTDHARDTPIAEIDAATAVEWLAGGRDPYRQVARSFHLIAAKNRP